MQLIWNIEGYRHLHHLHSTPLPFGTSLPSRQMPHMASSNTSPPNIWKEQVREDGGRGYEGGKKGRGEKEERKGGEGGGEGGGGEGEERGGGGGGGRKEGEEKGEGRRGGRGARGRGGRHEERGAWQVWLQLHAQFP